MKWNLRVQAAERGIWKSAELRRMLADAGLEISLGKMSALWTGTPTTIRLDDLDVFCHVLGCQPTDLLVPEPDKVAARKQQPTDKGAVNDAPGVVKPRFGPNDRPAPPV
ncbi:MAG: helix-turn-helix transcriptional regulator [Pseudoclavibacter sp.]|uniref:helix-turn-helix domain-containing protein n=1 Tax=Propioniciclava soli TaxID=2775081 RepID=UPI001E6559BC|nr:helix-turn-helix transcriptional regulator [Propioniciclava soli]